MDTGATNRHVIRRSEWAASAEQDAEARLTREWLLTNGLGGYASGTVVGVITRRYHGLLVAALPTPIGRAVMLSHLDEEVITPSGEVARLGGHERVGQPLDLPGLRYLREFRLELGLPVWQFEIAGHVVERRVVLPHLQNTVHVSYQLLSGGGTLRLRLRPSMNFRPHERAVSEPLWHPYTLSASGEEYEVAGDPRFPPLRLALAGQHAEFTLSELRIPELLYRVEESRGYQAAGDLWSPGFFSVDLTDAAAAAVIASTEDWRVMRSLGTAEALAAEVERRGRLLQAAGDLASDAVAAELVLAADQYVIAPAGRAEDAARAHAIGDEVRTVIAGYHWFTDWGRDTMISLEGLTLTTHREAEAGYILRTFAGYVRDGLIPNMFPEADREGLYHTADATLWFFHAIDRYVAATGDERTLTQLLPVLVDILQHHLEGTRFGIRVDPSDGLLRQGAEGYQLTWMDAKVDDWVVTPRRGKAVEINALWYNALRLLQGWLEAWRHPRAADCERYARRARASFNRRFWYERGGYLYDVVDGEQGDDAACRPNQLLAISLRHPVLEPQWWRPVLEVVEDRLLTPVGLRSLSPEHPEYETRYYGDLRARDAAYHQGTVWAWLIGPFLDAWLKVHAGNLEGARARLEGFMAHLDEGCIGSISEIFDAKPPFTPRGCVAQAWSVAEVLRCWSRLRGNRRDP
jgi:predicted glycogen debranching enzyme